MFKSCLLCLNKCIMKRAWRAPFYDVILYFKQRFNLLHSKEVGSYGDYEIYNFKNIYKQHCILALLLYARKTKLYTFDL